MINAAVTWHLRQVLREEAACRHCYLTATTKRVGVRAALRPLYPGKGTPYAFYMKLVGSRSRSGGVRKLSPPTGFKRIRNDRGTDKREFHGRDKRILFSWREWGGGGEGGGGRAGKSATFLQVSRASPARHYDKSGGTNVKKLWGWEIMACLRVGGSMTVNGEVQSLEK